MPVGISNLSKSVKIALSFKKLPEQLSVFLIFLISFPDLLFCNKEIAFLSIALIHD